MKSFLSKIFAFFISRSTYSDQKNAVELQEKVLLDLLQKASSTDFGVDHSFDAITSYDDFKSSVPVRDYEGLKPYIDKVRNGGENVLWIGKPIYFSKTSGTTSGSKYIPITSESIRNHINSARNALLCYINETGKSDFVDGKMIFLQGSPELKNENGIDTGRLSGIVAHHVPVYLQKNRLPSFHINCIEDWESKVEAITEETLKEDMRLISGIPPWVQMYFEKLIEKSGQKTISDIFPNFSLLMYGGVNYKPYQNKIDQIIGKKIDSIEVYPASEGFISFQDSQKNKGMLLNVNSGIFFEFIKAEHIFDEDVQRISLRDVELNTNYAIILSNNAGLWAYNIGDTIKFVSLSPYRIIVSGRIKHFTSAFGEHVIAEEVEAGADFISEKYGLRITEFHVAPLVETKENQLPQHQWFIEMTSDQQELSIISKSLDNFMCERNSYYQDLREGNVLQELEIKRIRTNGFNEYMKSIGKLGGQNKLPRLSNDRNVADELEKFVIDEL